MHRRPVTALEPGARASDTRLRRGHPNQFPEKLRKISDASLAPADWAVSGTVFKATGLGRSFVLSFTHLGQKRPMHAQSSYRRYTASDLLRPPLALSGESPVARSMPTGKSAKQQVGQPALRATAARALRLARRAGLFPLRDRLRRGSRAFSVRHLNW